MSVITTESGLRIRLNEPTQEDQTYFDLKEQLRDAEMYVNSLKTELRKIVHRHDKERIRLKHSR